MSNRPQPAQNSAAGLVWFHYIIKNRVVQAFFTRVSNLLFDREIAEKFRQKRLTISKKPYDSYINFTQNGAVDLDMKKSYFPQEGVWLKGNLHSHSTVSDGVLSPSELAKGYFVHGYDFLSMSDHNVFVPHNELPEDQILLMTGVEHDIEYSPDKCTHVVGTGAPEKKETGYECRRYSSKELTDQALIDMMREDGQFVMLAHPVWSRMEPEEIAALRGYHAIEVYNNGTEHLCHGGNAEVYWDLLLRRGIRVFATASDDVHVPDDLYGGWIWVKAAERSKSAILDALRHGFYYSCSGPTIYDLGMEEDQVYVSCYIFERGYLPTKHLQNRYQRPLRER